MIPSRRTDDLTEAARALGAMVAELPILFTPSRRPLARRWPARACGPSVAWWSHIRKFDRLPAPAWSQERVAHVL